MVRIKSRETHFSLPFHYFVAMAQGNDNQEVYEWGQILKSRFRAFDVEKSIYIASQKVANGPLMFAQYIYDALRPGDVPDNLRNLYREALFGTNQKVRARIISRIYSIGRIVRYV